MTSDRLARRGGPLGRRVSNIIWLFLGLASVRDFCVMPISYKPRWRRMSAQSSRVGTLGELRSRARTRSEETRTGWTLPPLVPTIRAMGPHATDQWTCRICRFDRYRQVTVVRKGGSRHVTAFFACSQCSVIFLNPQQWNGSATAQSDVNVEAPPDVVTPMRLRRR